MRRENKKTKCPAKENGYDHLDDAFTNACSPTECTGLITATPLTEAEYESYMDIYDFEPPYVIKKNNEKEGAVVFGADRTADDITKQTKL